MASDTEGAISHQAAVSLDVRLRLPQRQGFRHVQDAGRSAPGQVAHRRLPGFRHSPGARPARRHGEYRHSLSQPQRRSGRGKPAFVPGPAGHRRQARHRRRLGPDGRLLQDHQARAADDPAGKHDRQHACRSNSTWRWPCRAAGPISPSRSSRPCIDRKAEIRKILDDYGVPLVQVRRLHRLGRPALARSVQVASAAGAADRGSRDAARATDEGVTLAQLKEWLAERRRSERRTRQCNRRPAIVGRIGYLLDHGADVNTRFGDGYTPLDQRRALRLRQGRHLSARAQGRRRTSPTPATGLR